MNIVSIESNLPKIKKHPELICGNDEIIIKLIIDNTGKTTA